MEDLFLQTVRNNDVNSLKLCLPYIENINVLGHEGWNALFNALTNRNYEIMKILIDAGADVNCRWSNSGGTVLHSAIGQYKVDINIIKLLIDAGADVNHQYNGFNVLDQFLDNILGCKIDATNYNELVNLLCDNGADINHLDNNGYSLFDRVFKQKYYNTDLTELLYNRGADIDHADPNTGQTLLFYAISNRNIKIAEFLLLHGANVNHHDNSDITPLYHAMYLGNQDMIKLIQNYGGTFDIYDSIHNDYV